MVPADSPLDQPWFPVVRGLVDELPVGVLLLDASGQILFANRAERRWAGEAQARVVGSDLFRELVSHLETDGLGEQYRRAAAGGSVFLDRETSVPAIEGDRLIRLVLRSFPWHGSTFGVALIEDRTPLNAEAERRKRVERLAAVGELAAGVAHEVNNPLASIKSFAQLLAKDSNDVEQREAL